MIGINFLREKKIKAYWWEEFSYACIIAVVTACMIYFSLNCVVTV